MFRLKFGWLQKILIVGGIFCFLGGVIYGARLHLSSKKPISKKGKDKLKTRKNIAYVATLVGVLSISVGVLITIFAGGLQIEKESSVGDWAYPNLFGGDYQYVAPTAPVLSAVSENVGGYQMVTPNVPILSSSPSGAIYV